LIDQLAGRVDLKIEACLRLTDLIGDTFGALLLFIPNYNGVPFEGDYFLILSCSTLTPNLRAISS